MGFHVQRHNYVKVSDLIKDIASDLSLNGFDVIFNGDSVVGAPPGDPVPDTFKLTLEATPSVDPLAATQKWRVHFNVINIFQCKMYVASDTQLPDNGTTSLLERGLSLTQADSAGVIGSDLPYPYVLSEATLMVPPNEYNQITTYDVQSIARTKRINNADRQFIDRSIRIPDLSTAQAYPMSYMLNISPRGFSLAVWEEQQDPTGMKYSWVVVQRPVDRNTGTPLISLDTKTPLFCVYGLKDMYVPAAIKPNTATGGASNKQVIYPERWESGIKKFVVREQDIFKPTPSYPASYDSDDSNAILNDKQQVSITEDNKYILTFPNKLNTPRYAYTHELDLLAYTSADVVSQRTEVPITVYNEPDARIYTALFANGSNNTNMRLLLLTENGGV